MNRAIEVGGGNAIKFPNMFGFGRFGRERQRLRQFFAAVGVAFLLGFQVFSAAYLAHEAEVGVGPVGNRDVPRLEMRCQLGGAHGIVVRDELVRYDVDNLTDYGVFCLRCFRASCFHIRVGYTESARKATLNRILQVTNGMLVITCLIISFPNGGWLGFSVSGISHLCKELSSPGKACTVFAGF